jgi:predicted RNase H-like HicB family nuclease
MVRRKLKTVHYRNLIFNAVIKPAEEGGFYAYCPLLPGCVSEGETYAETVANIEEAIKGYVETMIEHNDPIPVEAKESNYSVDIPLSVPASGLRFA